MRQVRSSLIQRNIKEKQQLDLSAYLRSAERGILGGGGDKRPNTSKMSESLEQNDAVDPIRTDLDYWKDLKETCERNQKAVLERELDEEGEDKGNVKMDFIKEQLGKKMDVFVVFAGFHVPFSF